MKIILAVADYKGKNVVFVSDDFQILSLDETVRLTKVGVFEDLSVVQRGSGVYLRTKKSIPKERELGAISLSGSELISVFQGFVTAKSTPAMRRYLELYNASLVDSNEFIFPVGQSKAPVAVIRDTVVANKDSIFHAARQFNVDPSLLGAILIDEIARRHPIEGILDILGVYVLGSDTSVGIAQVKTDTANGLIRERLYNPNLRDPKLPFKRMNRAARRHLYTYLIQPKHSIFFEAARIRGLVDEWHPYIDITKRLEIITTLYHLPHRPPRENPDTNPRGVQIIDEFYPLVKKWLQ